MVCLAESCCDLTGLQLLLVRVACTMPWQHRVLLTRFAFLQLQAWLHKTGVHVEVQRKLEALKSSIDMNITTTMKVRACMSDVTAHCHNQ